MKTSHSPLSSNQNLSVLRSTFVTTIDESYEKTRFWPTCPSRLASFDAHFRASSYVRQEQLDGDAMQVKANLRENLGDNLHLENENVAKTPDC